MQDFLSVHSSEEKGFRRSDSNQTSNLSASFSKSKPKLKVQTTQKKSVEFKTDLVFQQMNPHEKRMLKHYDERVSTDKYLRAFKTTQGNDAMMQIYRIRPEKLRFSRPDFGFDD